MFACWPRGIGGPFAEAKELIAGYWVIQAPSREAVIEWFKRSARLHAADAVFEGLAEVRVHDDLRQVEPVRDHRLGDARVDASDDALGAEQALLRGCLPLLQAAAAEGEADPAEVAMLEDRIRVHEGRPQRFGTQYDWSDDGEAMVPTVGVEAPESLAERRAAVGLPPMAWRRPPPPGEAPPADRAARQAGKEAWERRVGWR